MLYVMMELAIVGSDIQEVLGSAIGLNILFGLDLWLGCLITGADTFTFLAVHHLGVRKLEALVTTLVGTMALRGVDPRAASGERRTADVSAARVEEG